MSITTRAVKVSPTRVVVITEHEQSGTMEADVMDLIHDYEVKGTGLEKFLERNRDNIEKGRPFAYMPNR